MRNALTIEKDLKFLILINQNGQNLQKLHAALGQTRLARLGPGSPGCALKVFKIRQSFSMTVAAMDINLRRKSEETLL